jgi:hypothetical protein
MVRRAPALVVALVILSLPSVAGEKPSPEEAYRRVVAAFHEPDEKHAFRLETRFVMGGESHGTCVFEAEIVTEQDGEKHWGVSERVDVRIGTSTMDARVLAVLDRRLTALRGRDHHAASGVVEDVIWRRTGEGHELKRLDFEKKEAKLVLVPGSRECLATYAGLMLLCRLAPREPAELAFRWFDPDPDEGEPHVVRAKLRFVGPGKWHGLDAEFVEANVGGDSLVFAFEPKTRRPLGFRMGARDDPTASELLPPELVPEKTPSKGYAAPGSTALEAGLAAALALASGDEKLLEKIIHWPTLLTLFRARFPDQTIAGDEAKFRTWVVGRLLASSPRKPRDLAIAILERHRAGVVVEEAGLDRAVVRFPEVSGGLVLRVGKTRDGSWYLVSPVVR